MVFRCAEAKRSRRDFVLDRDGDKCVYCEADQRGPTFLDKCPVRLTMDHLLPISLGGPTIRSNLVACCGRCNSVRGNRDIVEWLLALKPRDTYRGERAVRMVLGALRSDMRTEAVELLLEQVTAAFPYVR